MKHKEEQCQDATTTTQSGKVKQSQLKTTKSTDKEYNLPTPKTNLLNEEEYDFDIDGAFGNYEDYNGVYY